MRPCEILFAVYIYKHVIVCFLMKLYILLLSVDMCRGFSTHIPLLCSYVSTLRDLEQSVDE